MDWCVIDTVHAVQPEWFFEVYGDFHVHLGVEVVDVSGPVPVVGGKSVRPAQGRFCFLMIVEKKVGELAHDATIEAEHQYSCGRGMQPVAACRSNLQQKLVIRQIAPRVALASRIVANSVGPHTILVELLDLPVFGYLHVRSLFGLVTKHGKDGLLGAMVISLKIFSIGAAEHAVVDVDRLVLPSGFGNFNDQDGIFFMFAFLHLVVANQGNALFVRVVESVEECLAQGGNVFQPGCSP